MNEADVRKYLAEIGRRGGKKRMETMSADERRASALKAAKASAKARQKKSSSRKKNKTRR